MEDEISPVFSSSISSNATFFLLDCKNNIKSLCHKELKNILSQRDYLGTAKITLFGEQRDCTALEDLIQPVKISEII